MIKLIAADMDGTLMGNNGKISKENLEAIQVAQENGIDFAIATGRSYEDVKPFLDEYGLSCECVVLNGGEYRDIEGKLVVGIYIDKSRATKILNLMLKYDLEVEIYTDDGCCYTPNTKEKILKGNLKRTQIYEPDVTDPDVIYMHCTTYPHFINMKYITNLEEFLDSDLKIGKFIAFAESNDQINAFKKELNKLDGLVMSSSFVTNIEINDVNANKGCILVQVAERMGISKEEVAVLGDGSNDYSMFVEFPNSFAMENAVPEIKKAAKYMTTSNCEHGVAKAIYRILDI